MKEQLPIKPRRRLYTKDEVKRVHVYLPLSYVEEVNRFRKSVFEFSKQKVTLAYVLREGGLSYMRSIRQKMSSAKKGVFHAKLRKTLI